jgi:hydrogenase maturation protein HypF
MRPSDSREGRRIRIRGVVQGVGFRPWVYRLAVEAGLVGQVLNDGHGVAIDAFGATEALDSFCDGLRADPPPAAHIRELRWEPLPAPEELPELFAIVASRVGEERQVSIPADLATCDLCLAELFDSEDRRFGYPFLNCTHCGPRFTIALDVPYDRPQTTMAVFDLCTECAAEYSTPSDRRFHAQPNACPRCGPRLELRDDAGAPLSDCDPIASAAAALLRGEVVAVKGIGGFHLACDATSEAAVVRLRQRKHRESKPLAVMVASLGEARRIATVGAVDEELLGGPERPIVLLRARPDSGLARAVAPELPLVGLLLPYAPVHHLLLARTARPLVMTSGNRSDEPIACDNDEALARLRGIADLFLVHDREIASRCDDSVARTVAAGPVLLRRSRGFVPLAVPLCRPVERPVLACGADLKNACCLAVGDSAYLGPHVGDLETVEAADFLCEAIERMERFVGVRPEVIAHDLHPDYQSTRYALARPETKVAVQHHHAHLASALAEHGRDEALGVIYDGTGLGTDGAAWGGEILYGTVEGFERIATFRPLPLAGGEQAIREVWRLALALLDDAYHGEAPCDRIPLFAGLDQRRVELVRALQRRRVSTPLAHGVGRYFDAFGALALGREVSRFEGDVALAFAETAAKERVPGYPFRIDWDSEPWEIDLRLATRAAVEEVVCGARAGHVSARFHATLVAATEAAVRAFVHYHRPLPVMLSGGCFANPLLAEGLLERLGGGLEVLLQRSVPPGDGGIALGQAVVADALAGKPMTALVGAYDDRSQTGTGR